MCTTCGCGDTELVPVELHEKILAGNDRAARHNREHFVEAGVLALNIMGSPGAGKTGVLEATAKAAAAKGWKLGAVSADLATDNDARRLDKAGIPSKAITTGQACHLDAELVHRSLHGFPWQGTDVFFIENVGNLVCPAIYDLGQAANVVVLSVTEGEDKPLKYPVMFKAADLVLVTKVDLVPHLDVDLARIHDALARVMPRPRAIELSARTGLGMDRWIAWLEELRGPIRKPREVRTHLHHAHGADEGHAHEHVHTHEHEHEHGGEKHGHGHAHEHAHGHSHDGSEEHLHGGPEHAHQDGAGHRHRH
ncbi:MAG TPA: hydrogenase nickel incorporation protein HypB [Anaeromyxobacter sp.]|nr:hydrogenase nickel incorporation protein HypB [Anaeromyxobacter sp.]